MHGRQGIIFSLHSEAFYSATIFEFVDSNETSDPLAPYHEKLVVHDGHSDFDAAVTFFDPKAHSYINAFVTGYEAKSKRKRRHFHTQRW